MSTRAFIFGLFVAALLVIGLYRAKDGARDSSEEIARLETEIAEAYRQKSLLEAELAHLSRREWVEEYARNELGMAPARANQFATDYNLDLLVGPPEAASESQTVPAPQPSADAPSVSVPVSDASNPEAEEGAGQK